MGRSSSTITERPASASRTLAPSMMRSVITAVFLYISHFVTYLHLAWVTSVGGVQEIQGATQKSNNQELVHLKESVDRMVNRVASALENDQLQRQTGVKENLEELQKTLHTVSRQTVRIDSGGLFAYSRRLLFPKVAHIDGARMQLDDALRVFLVASLVELLSERSKPPAKAEAPEPFHAFEPPARLPHTQHRPARRATEHAHNIVPFPLRLDQHISQSHVRRPEPRQAPNVAARSLSPEAGEMSAALTKVESCRHLVQLHRGPIQEMELATALGHLSELLGKAGKAREALEASQESAELYRTLTDSLKGMCQPHSYTH